MMKLPKLFIFSEISNICLKHLRITKVTYITVYIFYLIMHSILRFSAITFRARHYSPTFFRYVRNPSKRSGMLKTLKDFKVKLMNEGEDDDVSFEIEELTRRIKNDDMEAAEGFERGEDLETIVTESSKLYEAQIGEELNRKTLTKKKLIGRKYFQSGKETNLLTHAAKEQIRYLHKLNPLDWTPETLSKSFPISVDGAKKLLKSYFTLKDPVKIKEHDEDVREKWESLMSGVPSEKIHFHTQCLWNAGKLIKENYNGNPNLPYKPYLTTQNITKVTKKKPLGDFSAIIKNYMEYKNKQEAAQTNSSELIVSTEKDHNGRKLTAGVEHDLELHDFVQKSKFFKEEGDIVVKKSSFKDEAELPFSQFKENMKHQLQHESRKSNTSKQYHEWVEQDSKANDFKNRTDSYNTKDFVSKISKYNKDNIEMKRERKKSGDSLYLYTDKTGYQRPVGQTIKGKISIPSSAKKKNTSYKIKNCVYDDNGEFLYKLPS